MTSSISSSVNTQMTKAAMQEQIANTAIATVQEIVVDNERRMNGYKQDVNLLGGGIFYGNSYYEVLEGLPKNKALLDHFVKHGNFFHGLAPSAHFQMVPNPNASTGITPNCCLLKANVLPSVGLRSIREGRSFLGCGEVCQIGHYEALKKVWGTEKFDVVFSSAGTAPNRFAVGINNSAYNPLQALISSGTLAKGQQVYFQNIPNDCMVASYGVKHINGETAGFHTLCCDATPGQEKFVTLGLPATGATQEEISEILRAEYNKKPIGMKIVTEAVGQRVLASWGEGWLARSREYEDFQCSKWEFAAADGGQMVQIIGLNIDRVHQLARDSNQQAQTRLAQWTDQHRA